MPKASPCQAEVVIAFRATLSPNSKARVAGVGLQATRHVELLIHPKPETLSFNPEALNGRLSSMQTPQVHPRPHLRPNDMIGLGV